MFNNISWRKQAQSQYDQVSSDEDDLDLNEDDGFYWEKGEDPTEPTSDSESCDEILMMSTARTSSSSSRRRSAKERATTTLMATDEILPQSMNEPKNGHWDGDDDSPSEDENSTLSSENSLDDSNGVTLELGPSEFVSPLGGNTPTFFTGNLSSLDPPLHTPPTRGVRRTGSSINRGQTPSSGRTVRRTISLDYKLQKTALIQSLNQCDGVENNEDTKPRRHTSLNLKPNQDTKPRRHASLNLKTRRRRPMDFSYRSDHDQLLSGSTRTDSRVIMSPINDDRNHHSRTRSMTRLLSPSRMSGTERLQRNQRSFGSLSSSSGEKLNRSARSHQRRNQRNSVSDVDEYLQMQFTSVEGTDGCCVIKRRSRSTELKKSQSKSNSQIERSRSFELIRKTSKPPIIGRTRSESRERLEAIKLARSESRERLEAKLAKLVTKKNQRELKSPSSLRKQKNEISAIFNQAHERHRQRYSAKKVEDSEDEDE